MSHPLDYAPGDKATINWIPEGDFVYTRDEDGFWWDEPDENGDCRILNDEGVTGALIEDRLVKLEQPR